MAVRIVIDDVLRAAPDAPSELTFADEKEKIRFGRIDRNAPASDVAFNARLVELGRSHFELQRSAGGYEIVTNDANPVFVDGMRVNGRMRLTLPTEVRLNSMAGPAVRIAKSVADNGNVTVDEGRRPQKSLQVWLEQVAAKVRAMGIYGAATAAALALSFAGLLAFNLYETSRRQAFEATMIAEASRVMDVFEASTSSWESTRLRVAPSVYQVVQKSLSGVDRPLATAWVLDEHKLVTNAHAVTKLEKAIEDGTIYVISTDRYQADAVVRSVSFHPFYRPHRETFAKVFTNVNDGGCGARSPEEMAGFIGSFDIAILQTSPDTELADPLPVAQSEPGIGTEVASIGYSIETAQFRNQQQFRSGVVSGWTDISGVTRDGGTQELMYHNLAASGGSSGSPIFNKQGEVVAIHSGGEVSRTAVSCQTENRDTQSSAPRQISGSGTFYAQNVRWLADFNKSPSPGELRKLQQDWTSVALSKIRASEIAANLSNFADQNKEDLQDEALMSESAVLVPQVNTKDGMGSFLVTRKLASGTYLSAAITEKDEKLALQVKTEYGQLLTPLFVDAKPVAVFHSVEEGQVTFAVFGKANTTITLKVIKLDE